MTITLEDLHEGLTTYENLLKEACTPEEVRRYEQAVANAKINIYNYRLRRLEDRVEKSYGGTFDEWWETVKKMYYITENYTVVSNAIEWKTDRIWECSDIIEAQEKILELCGYKNLDRNRGRGSRQDDVDRVKEIYGMGDDE